MLRAFFQYTTRNDNLVIYVPVSGEDILEICWSRYCWSTAFRYFSAIISQKNGAHCQSSPIYTRSIKYKQHEIQKRWSENNVSTVNTDMVKRMWIQYKYYNWYKWPNNNTTWMHRVFICILNMKWKQINSIVCFQNIVLTWHCNVQYVCHIALYRFK